MKFAKAHFGCGVVALSEQKSVLVAGWYDPLGLTNAEINPRAEQLILDFSKATSDWKWRVSRPSKKRALWEYFLVIEYIVQNLTSYFHH